MLSVSKMVRAGHTVVFSPQGAYIYDEESGEVMNMEEQGGMYMLKMWVKRTGFPGQGDSPQAPKMA